MKNDSDNITHLPFESEEDSASQYHSILLELKKLDKTDLHDFLKKVLDVVANALNVDRVSLWFFNEGKSSIYCDYLYIKKYGEFANEVTLHVKDYPHYFKAIDSQLYVSANDAQNDPQTKELAKEYLISRKICSMMDIPVHYRGETIGIICHEIQDNYHEWKREEIDFTTAISTLVSTSLEIDIRKQREHDLQESQRFLGTLISNLPGYVYRVTKDGNEWKTQYISDGVYELTGYPTQAFTDGTAYYVNLVYDEDKPLTREVVVKALNEQKPYKITYRIKTMDGRLLWVWEQGRGVYSASGELIATEGFITNITEKKLYEEELVRKNHELSVLNYAGQTLSKLAEPDEIIANIYRMLGMLFDVKNLYIALYDSAKNTISFPLYTIEGKEANAPERIFSSGLTEHIIKTQKPLLVNTAKENLYKKNNITPFGKDALSIISAPMIAGEKTIGVITLQDYENENVYSSSQLDILSTLAAQAGIALENSNLYAEIKKSLREKDILLQEVHHRVKNNLQIMSSLVKLQSHYIKDEKMLDIMKETESRIHSMAIVHSKLYSTKDYEQVNFAEYVKSLTDNFWNTFGFKLKNISFKIDILDIKMNIDTAIPCGLIINELVSNAIKYAFPESKKGEILISLRLPEGNIYELRVKDNGIGFDSKVDISSSDTLGIQLVTLLTKQMNGTLDVKSEKGSGAEFIFKFQETVYKSRRL